MAVQERSVVLSEHALAATERLFSDAVAAVVNKLSRVEPLDAGRLPSDRVALQAELDRWAGSDTATWRRELRRFYEQHVPVYVRPDAQLNAVLRRLARGGTAIGVWSPGPAEAVAVLLDHLGVSRSVAATACGGGQALADLAVELGGRPLVVVAAASEAQAAAAAGLDHAAAGWRGFEDDGVTGLAQPHDLLTAAGAPAPA